MLKISQLLTLLLVFESLYFLGDFSSVYAQDRIPKYLNEDAEREFEVQPNIDLTRFDIYTKTADIDVYWTIVSRGPFEALVKTVGDSNLLLNVEQQVDSDFYEVSQREDSLDIPIRRNYFGLNPWPFDKYSIDMYIQLNDTAKVKYYDPPSVYFRKSMENNPEWQVKVDPKISSHEEMKNRIKNWQPREGIVDVFNFEIILAHSDEYIQKHLIYSTMNFVPIAVMVVHMVFVKSRRLTIHATLFTGIAILLITGMFAIRQYFPPDVTIFETGILAIMGAYLGWFVGRLYLLRNEDSCRDNHPILR